MKNMELTVAELDRLYFDGLGKFHGSDDLRVKVVLRTSLLRAKHELIQIYETRLIQKLSETKTEISGATKVKDP